MKIRFLKNGVSDGTGRKWAWGDTADIPDDVAKVMIENGVAKIDDTAPVEGTPAGNFKRMRKVEARVKDEPTH